MSKDTLATVVVVQREGFSLTRESLESIYQNTEIPFRLIYVDGNSPRKESQYLQSQSESKGFELIRINQYLFPNQARNIGLKRVETPYVVFIDNDVIVSSGWLRSLVECAEDTGAAVVGPLVCQYKPLHEEVHCAGGTAHIIVDAQGQRRLRAKLHLQGQKVKDVRPKLSRSETEHAEFHCVLARKSFIEKIGFLDERMFNTQEHFDFCMSIAKIGGKVYLEPNSVVTYLPAFPLRRWVDFNYHMLRWNDTWAAASINRLQEKWNLSDTPDLRHRIKGVRNMRVRSIIGPITQVPIFRFLRRPLKKVVISVVDPIFNQYVTKTNRQIIQHPLVEKVLDK